MPLGNEIKPKVLEGEKLQVREQQPRVWADNESGCQRPHKPNQYDCIAPTDVAKRYTSEELLIPSTTNY